MFLRTMRYSLFKGNSELNEGERMSRVNIRGLNSNISSTTKKDGSVHVFIRPEDIFLSKYDGHKPICDCGMNVLKGNITEVEQRGIFTRVIVDVGIFMSIFLTRRVYFEKQMKKRDQVYIMFNAKDVHVF